MEHRSVSYGVVWCGVKRCQISVVTLESLLYSIVYEIISLFEQGAQIAVIFEECIVTWDENIYESQILWKKVQI